MPVQLDPEERETKSLFAMAGDLRSKQILEVGCGNGRLTWRYAQQAAFVMGIDPDPDSIEEARRQTPPDLNQRVCFEPCELLQFHTVRLFDLVIMSWSL